MKKYREWLSEGKRVDRRDLLTPEQLEWCEKHIAVLHWWVNEEGEVEVEKNLTFRSKEDIEEFPVQFADVKEDFNCINCKNLTSLKGAPKRVGGYFDCNSCEGLTSLEGAPVEVRGYFDCQGCMNLTSLKGAPEKVEGSFSCYDCKNLTTLEGAPQEVGENFYATECNSLTSLEGLPKKFKDLYAATGCPKLPQVEKDFAKDEELQAQWKKSPLNWKQFIYGGAAKGRKFGL